MTQAIHEWLVSIASVAVLAGLCQGIMPAGTVQQVSRMTCGLLIFVVVIRPLARTNFEQLLEQFTTEYTATFSPTLNETNGELTRQLIANQTAAYIEERMGASGIECRVTVECDTDEAIPIPKRLNICGTLSEQQKRELIAFVEREFAIEQQNLCFTEEQPEKERQKGGGA